MLVTGPAGVGKTTLLTEAERLAGEAGIVTFCGGGDPAARAVPLGLLLDALVSAAEPPVDPARLHELSQSPDQRFWRGRRELTRRHRLLCIELRSAIVTLTAEPGGLTRFRFRQ